MSHKEGDKYSIDEIRKFNDEHRARLYPVEDERSHHNCRHSRTGDSQGHGRNELTPPGTVVPCFRSDNPIGYARSKFLRVPGTFEGLIVAQDVGDTPSGPGKRTNENPDDRGSEQVEGLAKDRLDRS